MPTDSEVERLCAEAVSTCAGYHLRRTARVATQLFDAAFAPLGLRSTQVAVLQMIAINDSASIAKLARAMAMDPSTLTRNIRPLIREGYVDLIPPERGRAKQARLTRKGLSRLNEIMDRWKQAQAEFTRRYGVRRWEQLRGELWAVVKAIAPE